MGQQLAGAPAAIIDLRRGVGRGAVRVVGLGGRVPGRELLRPAEVRQLEARLAGDEQVGGFGAGRGRGGALIVAQLKKKIAAGLPIGLVAVGGGIVYHYDF